MKNQFLALCLALLPFFAWSQRYLQPIFPAAVTDSGFSYGFAPTWNGTNIPLLMNVYEPVGDTQSLRPVIVLFHGGSFVTGVRTDPVMTSLCEAFASRGYVAITASYRLGVNLGNLPQLNLEFIRAAIRATHDMKAAVRFVRRSVVNEGNPFGLDTNRIYVGGYSAGAIAAIHAAYLTDTTQASVLLRNELRALGGIEGNSGNPGFSSKVHGVFNLAGAVLDTHFVATSAPTAIHFHGTADNVVPFGRGFVQANGFPVVEVDGSSLLHARLQSQAVYSELHAYNGIGHDLVMNASVASDIIAQAARFFYNLQNNSVSVNEVGSLQAALYPNPACGSLAVSGHDGSILHVSMFDTSGKRLISSEIGPDNRISVAELPAGLYIARIQKGAQSRMQKIIITKTCP